MHFALADDHRMLQELVRGFVERELLPLEPAVLRREIDGAGPHLDRQEQAHVDAASRALGLWGLDAPADMATRAVRDGDDWVLNGRKIWITRAAEADFTIVVALTDPAKRARGGMSAFLVDRGTPGFEVLRPIPMIGGHGRIRTARRLRRTAPRQATACSAPWRPTRRTGGSCPP